MLATLGITSFMTDVQAKKLILKLFQLSQQ